MNNQYLQFVREQLRSRVNNHWRKAHQLRWSDRLSLQHHRGGVPFWNWKNIRRRGYCGATVEMFAGKIRSL